jgi:DNA-binding CsgD family transcriptional regulator/tetratricopeptide (TPR) repeat protein
VSVLLPGEGMATGGFVGRGREVAVLRDLVAGVVAGRGGVVWMEGEPGIGKSALVRAGLAQASELGCAVFAGAGDRLREGLPLGVMLDCLDVSSRSEDRARADIAGLLRGTRSPAGGLARARSPERTSWLPTAVGDPVAMAAEMLCELVDELCTVSPVLVVVDDMQWADEASVVVWQRLAASAGVMPLGLVGVARPVPRPAAVADIRQRVADLGGSVIALGGLSDAEVAELVAGLVGARPGPRLAAMAGQAGGNPLYVRELVDALVRERGVRVATREAEVVPGAAVPTSVSAAIEGRLGFLPAQTLRVLREAALLGEEFTAADLAVVLGCAVRDLAGLIQEAVAVGVLATSGDGLVFRHALIMQAMAEGTPPSLRAGLHREAARALAEAGAAGEKVTAQLRAALALAPDEGLGGWAVGWLTAHAGELVHRAPKTAAGLLEEAVASAADGTDGQVLREHLAEVLFRLDRFEQAAAVAGHLTQTVADPERFGHTAWILAYAQLRAGQAGQAVESARQALAAPALPPRWDARLRAVCALVLARAGQDCEAEEMAQSALEAAERIGDAAAVGAALNTLATSAYRKDDFAGAIRFTDRALAAIGADPETMDLRLALVDNRLSLRSALGHDIEAEARQAIEFAEWVGTPRVNLTRHTLAEWLLETGRWDEALAELAPVFEPGSSASEQQLAACHGLAALIAVSRDDQALIDEHLSVRDVPGFYIPWGADLARARARAAERTGRPAEAVTILAPALDPGTGMGAEVRSDWLGDLVRCALAVGDESTASAAARGCAELARRSPGLPWIAPTALRCRGLEESDPGLLEQAAAGYKELRLRYEQAAALEDLAVTLGARGELARGKAALREAVEVYAGLGADWDIRRADARAREYGIRRRRSGTRRPATGWEALSPAEQKIAFLVAERLSNREIAGRMYLSSHTVRFYLSSIMAKLAVHSRVEVGQEATRHG